ATGTRSRVMGMGAAAGNRRRPPVIDWARGPLDRANPRSRDRARRQAEARVAAATAIRRVEDIWRFSSPPTHGSDVPGTSPLRLYPHLVSRYARTEMEPSVDAIMAALGTVIDPELQRPVTELNMVRDVEVTDGIVSVTVVLTVAGCPLRHSFEEQVERAFQDVPGVRGFSLSFDVMTPEDRHALTALL